MLPLRPLFPLLKLSGAIFFALVLLDALLFRTGAYFHVMEPDSTSGSVYGATLAVDRYSDPARKNVLVLGNSKIGEGFSAPIADAAIARSDLHFVNGSIAGTSPRVWYYFLRKVDPDAKRFAAVALMIEYDLSGFGQDLKNYPLDTSYAVSLLGLRDVVDYPASFTDADQRERARRAIALPLQALHEDARELLLHPIRRYRHVAHYRPAWLEAVGVYGGHEEALPDLPIDAQTGLPSDWGSDAATLRPKLEPYFRALRWKADPQQRASNADYEREWIGRIAARYRANGVPVIVFVVPRGPWHATLASPPQPDEAIAALARDGAITMLPGDAFTLLEKPQYFFDTLHMNRAGREIFSRRFAERVAPLVH
ncbi:MAG TPA: hypothetical protein VF132_01505 [Rudaea sp.]